MVEGLAGQEGGYEETSYKKFDEIEFTKGNDGERFHGTLQRILLILGNQNTEKRHLKN